MSATYEIAPLFLIRLAGVPFDVVERLATPGVIAVARQLLTRKEECADAKMAAEEFFRSRQRLLIPEVYHELRLAVRLNRAPAFVEGVQPGVFTNYAIASTAVSVLESELHSMLEKEVYSARRALLDASQNSLPQYLVFGAEDARDFLTDHLASYVSDLSALPMRNNASRKIEQTLLLYLQRIAAKNDTFSEFGPSSWGRVDPKIDAVRFDPQPGIAKREAFFERWAAHALAATINADAKIFSELRPRLNPNGALCGDNFVFADTGEAIQVKFVDADLLARCDGEKPMYELGASDETIRDLLAKNILVAAVEVPALDPYAFEKLREDVANWRPGAAREHWLPIVESFAKLPKNFGASIDRTQRREISAEARQKFAAFGVERKPGQRSLYSAINPIAEECFRQTNFAISERLINEVAVDAEPWIDFWRDSYAFVASRVAAGLRRILEQTPSKNGALSLPAFLRACEMSKLPLTGEGLVGLAHMAFQEIKATFRERMRPRAHLAEHELTAADCHFVRKNFQYEKFDEFTYPSADLQLSAASIDAISRGDYQWILSELHPPAALLHHAGYWSCPDKARLGSTLSSIAGKAFHFGFFAADFTAHTAIRVFDAIPELTTFVAPQRADPSWRKFPPAQTEVYIDQQSGDVRLRQATTREDLGSFARNWIIPLGFHPFQFGMSPQMPRLRCGRVIVQRRAWTVSTEELGEGDFSGLSHNLVVATEKLRAARDWPRFVYIRPTEQALRRSGAEGRDKDTKPVFVDLESYLFLEIFHRWLTKAGELEVTEMLPGPSDLCWQERDGRRTFELRTLLVPRT